RFGIDARQMPGCKGCAPEFVLCGGVELEEFVAQCGRQFDGLAGDDLCPAFGRHMQCDGVDRVQAGAGHQADINAAVLIDHAIQLLASRGASPFSSWLWSRYCASTVSNCLRSAGLRVRATGRSTESGSTGLLFTRNS